MLLDELATTSEREAFAGLAYIIARADGRIGYEESCLLNTFMEEMGFSPWNHRLADTPLNSLCQTIVNDRSKKIAYLNLQLLACVSGGENEAQKLLLELIRDDFALNVLQTQKATEEINILQGRYFPEYAD